MKRSNKSNRGSVLVETALASVVFSMLLFSIFDFGRMFYFQSRIQHAVSQSTRFATTGNVLEDPDVAGTSMSREDSIVHMIKVLSGVSDFGVDDIQIGAITATGAELVGAGGPGDVVTVRATYRVPIIAPFLTAMFPGGQYEFTCTTSFRNEEFPGAPQAALDGGVGTGAEEVLA